MTADESCTMTPWSSSTNSDTTMVVGGALLPGAGELPSCCLHQSRVDQSEVSIEATLTNHSTVLSPDVPGLGGAHGGAAGHELGLHHQQPEQYSEV